MIRRDEHAVLKQPTTGHELTPLMMTRRTIFIGITASLCLVLIAISFVVPPFLKARRSCAVMTQFSANLAAGNWEAARAMMIPDPQEEVRYQIRDGAVMHLESDVTNELSHAKPRLDLTFDYYLRDPRSRTQDKVVFRGRSVADYALLENGKIKRLKMP